MLLIGQYDSPYVRRVAISLTVLGLPFERRLLSVFGDADEMRGYNPLGRVPALVLDDGETLIDSAAVLDHLDEVAGPSQALLPPSGAHGGTHCARWRLRPAASTRRWQLPLFGPVCR